MGLLFLISFHFLLMIIYLLLIETKKSRLTYGHLLFAVFFPFVGEICLVAADIGKAPADHDLVKPFKKFSINKTNETYLVVENINEMNEITREQLLEVIKSQPNNLTDILKAAMKSSDIEVVHIAASSIMKAQRTYENRIKEVSEKYAEMPDNMGRLHEYIVAIGDYYNQGLLNGEASTSLLEQQEILLRKYLKVLPEDKEMGILMVRNLLLQGRYNEAEDGAELMRYLYMSDIELWELSAEVYTTTANTEKLQEMIGESQKMSGSWSQSDKARWIEIQKGLRK